MRQRRATQHSVFKVTVARCDLCGRFTLRGLLMKCVPVAVPPCTAGHMSGYGALNVKLVRCCPISSQSVCTCLTYIKAESA